MKNGLIMKVEESQRYRFTAHGKDENIFIGFYETARSSALGSGGNKYSHRIIEATDKKVIYYW